MKEINCDKCKNKNGCGWYLLGKQPKSCECYEEIKKKMEDTQK